MRRHLRALTLLVTIALATVAIGEAPCFAQPTSEREAQAEDLFQRGKEAMAAKDLPKACELFAESYRLDAAGGTLQNLAVCFEDLGKWASAYARFEELRTISKAATPPRQDRVALAEAHIATLRPRVSRVFVVLAPDARGRASDTTVKIDGTTYSDVSLNAGVLVDPGEHRVEVVAPGRRAFTTKVDVAGRDRAARAEVQVPALELLPSSPGSGNAPAPVRTRPTKTLGLVVSGAGVVALGAGATFGVLAIVANSSGKDRCTQSTNPSAPTTDFDATGHCLAGSQALADANADKSRASTFANVSNVLVPVGVVAVAVGVYLFLRERTEAPAPDARPRARLTPGLGATTFEVRF